MTRHLLKTLDIINRSVSNYTIETAFKIKAEAKVEMLNEVDEPTSPNLEDDTKYVWRTLGDDKVRSSHAANNGKLIDWDKPPEDIGHPGEDYNCRCIAEPYKPGATEYASQTQILEVYADGTSKWPTYDYVYHAYFGGGRDVTLSETGNLEDVFNNYMYDQGTGERVKSQVIEAARIAGPGYFEYNFENSYSFRDIIFALGSSTVRGKFSGVIREENGFMKIYGSVEYQFIDEFTDPVDVREKVFNEDSNPNNVSAWWLRASDLLSRSYTIQGSWKTTFEAEASFNSDESQYFWDDLPLDKIYSPNL